MLRADESADQQRCAEDRHDDCFDEVIVIAAVGSRAERDEGGDGQIERRYEIGVGT